MLEDRVAEPALFNAWTAAGIPETCHNLDVVLAAAAARDREACKRLVDIAKALKPKLRNPRGRVPSLASATHEIFFVMRGREGAYTYDSDSGDIIDPVTEATRLAMNDPDFDPRPAYRRRQRSPHR